MENISIIEQEELIRKYLDEDNKEAAVKLIFELVTACAKEKNFRAAEALRDRIFEIDPLALAEIIRSGEIIEEEKSEAIDKGHREIWGKLYDSLSVEEANVLYFALKTESYAPDTTVYAQGEHKPRLYFVNSGRLKIFYLKDGREVLLKMLGRGHIAGEDTFFSSNMCTTSMVTLGSAEVSYLDAEVLRYWKTGSPVLESKLQDFASRSKKIKDLIAERELDRRSLRRAQVWGRGDAHLMSVAAIPVGKPFRVDVIDISRGGAGFLVRITKKETANLLLGQKVNVRYVHPQTNASKTINQNGTIVAVRFHPLEDCSVSVKFDGMIEEKLIEEFERFSPPPAEFDY
ncbi:MAG: cyclic nucleotide-binding domain-containing protein [Syntrophobacteraceae bacterium]